MASLEALERREVMASDLSLYAPPTGLASEWAEQVLEAYQAPVPASGSFHPLESENAARDLLVDQLISTWRDVLGKPLNADLHVLSPLDIDYAVVNRLDPATGVDEPDQFAVSQDGYVFVRSMDHTSVKVIDARDPKNLRQVASIEVGYSSLLSLSGNNLVVISQPDEPLRLPQAYANFPRKTDVRVFDVSLPSQPQQTSHLQIDGRVTFARMSGNHLHLIVNDHRELLKPMFFAVDPTATYQSLSDRPIGRFETASEFAARVRPLVIDWVSGNVSSENQTSVEIAQWDDLLASGTSDFSNQSSVITFQLKDGALSLVDSKVLAGGYSQLLYADTDNVYVLAGQIFAFGVGGASVELEGVGEVHGYIRELGFADEYNGFLRVFSNSIKTVDGVSRTVTDLNVYKKTSAHTLEIVGQLVDIGDGQPVLSAHFMGENAVITTGATGLDPLHGVDLSDPTHPVKISDLAIPGFITFLQPVGESLFVGAGYFQDEKGVWRAQVSLYSTTDLRHPKLLDSWISDYSVFRSQGGYGQTLATEFDAATGLLTLPQFDIYENFDSDSEIKSVNGVQVFKIDSASSDPLKFIDQVGHSVQRATIVGDTLLTISNTLLLAYEISGDKVNLADYSFIANPLTQLQWSVQFGRDQQIDLVGDSVDLGQRVTWIGTSNVGARISLSENGRTLTYFAPEKASPSSPDDLITFTVTYPDGAAFERSLRVYFYQPIAPITPVVSENDNVNSGLVELTVRFVDDNGEVATNLEVGEEYWLQLIATDRRDFPAAIYGAWVDLAFAGGSLTTAGQPQGSNSYRKTVRGSMSGNDKIVSLGALTNQLVSARANTFEITRVRVRAEVLGDMHLSVQQAADDVYKSRLLGEGYVIDVAKMHVVTPNIKVIDSRDTNADGEITPIDAMLLVDQLNEIRASIGNEQSSGAGPKTPNSIRAAQLDVSGDDKFSPLDVLIVINFLNDVARSSNLAGEGESKALAVDDAAPIHVAEQTLACDVVEVERSQRTMRRRATL